jgi:GT2 family glycosyltransferase
MNAPARPGQLRRVKCQPTGHKQAEPRATNVHAGLMLFDEETHFAALEALSLRCLSEGDLTQAFRLADRRCRIPPVAEAHHFTLRGEISHMLGHTNDALADLKRALDLAPEDIAANRRILLWGTGKDQVEAAQRLLTIEHDFSRIAAAVEVLPESEKRAVAKIESTYDQVTGWVGWTRSSRVKILLQCGDGAEESIWIEADESHPLAATFRHASNFIIKRPRSTLPQRVVIFAGATKIFETRLPPNLQSARIKRPSPPKASPARNRPAAVSVVVPVYGDYEATRACLDTLKIEIAHDQNARLIIVDDAAPDPRINDLLREISAQERTQLLTNEENLGFAESVNKALAEITGGDVILLNADTLVPPGFIARLTAIANGTPGTGTITPLTNNGEFTSFPVRFRENPLPSYDDICAIDAAAARANGENPAIDMPNGIGFCLYITRDCLDAVGELSTIFRRGYFEDVEFCLRARECGFRNLCATSVYVGHAGSKSFGSGKRALVVRNLSTMERNFPRYRIECGAFLEADPLGEARQALERELAAFVEGATLLVSAAGPSAAVMKRRAKELSERGERVLLAQIRRTGHGLSMTVSSSGKDIPQSLCLPLSSANECAKAISYLERIRPARLEVASIEAMPPAVFNHLLNSRAQIDIFVADGGLICPRGAFMRPDGALCEAPRTRRLCDECSFALAEGNNSEALEAKSSMQKILWERAEHVLAPSRQAESFASRFFGHHPITLTAEDADRTEPAESRQEDRAPSIGFVAVGAAVSDHALMKQVALALNQALPERGVVIIGQTLNDLELIRLDNVFVTGPVQLDEHERILRQYAIDTLFVPMQRALFGHPELDSLSALRPTAAFDWSFGRVSSRGDDLPLSPYFSHDEITEALLSWLPRN